VSPRLQTVACQMASLILKGAEDEHYEGKFGKEVTHCWFRRRWDKPRLFDIACFS
jgi:hypothetical protein